MTAIKNKEKTRQFAVCPVCDNPIEIIGLYKRLKNTKRPYGKHYSKSVKGLAVYSSQAYEFCLYAVNKKVSKSSKKSVITNYERNIYNLLREQFDRVIYVLSKEIDIKITNTKGLTALSARLFVSSKRGSRR